MDIPLDVQAKIDALMAEYESTPKTSIWMGYRSPARHVDSSKGVAILAEISELKRPYMPKVVKWSPESKADKARRVAVAVRRALKQEKEGRI